MKKVWICILLAAAPMLSSFGQNVGLSFSYFIPKNGYFSTPISPFSIRGLGVDLNRYVAIETGATLYRMSGLNLKDLPFESKDALVGPNFTIFVPAELVLQLKGPRVEFDIKGGGFFFYGFDQKINYGNFDRALKAYEQWTVANAEADFKNYPGFGYHAGVELTIFVTGNVGVSIETNYLIGEAKFPIVGSYVGGTSSLETKSFDYADSKIDFTGLEFSVGLIFTGNQQPAKPKKRRRR
ncbi:MAG TPA: hypothetical protein VEB86_17240 [Chryseosolibacter sp.]|nr:hypothetical protein [Chryseosolibacter sp.]